MILPIAGQLLVALLATQAGAAADDPGPAPEVSEALRFADWLSERGDYYRAIGEYQRALYLDRPGIVSDALELRIARAYALGGQPDAAAEVLSRLELSGKDARTRDAALFEHGRLRYATGQAQAAVALLKAYLSRDPPAGGPGVGRARLLLGLAHLRAGDDTGAHAALEGIRRDDPLSLEGARLRLRLDEVASAPHRSPIAAGLLSAALPGLGHVYAGNSVAGAGALALNGVFIWATVESFRARRPAAGTLFLVGESIWYGGAIFGAVAEAMRFNRDGRAQAIGAAEAPLGWVFGVAPLPGGVAVEVRVPLPVGSPSR